VNNKIKREVNNQIKSESEREPVARSCTLNRSIAL